MVSGQRREKGDKMSGKMFASILVGMFLVLSLFGNVTWEITSAYDDQPGSITGPTAPVLTNQPRLDTIVTNDRPLLSIFNSESGTPPITYVFQIDLATTFDSKALMEYRVPASTNLPVTSKRVEEGDELTDNSIYYWRVKAIDGEGGESCWGTEVGNITARFEVNLTCNKGFANLVRIPVIKVTASTGKGEEKLTNLGGYDDAMTQWVGRRDLFEHFIQLDLGDLRGVSRIWLLCDREKLDGRIKEFFWECSEDGKDWKMIEGTQIRNSDAFRWIQDFATAKSRYFRLVITDWHGSSPRINEIELFGPGNPPILDSPDGDYVLVVGNEHDGKEYGDTSIVSAIEKSGFSLKTLLVPYYEINLKMLKGLDHPPVAIILSGFSRWYETLPMFEFNGEYEIIRESSTPILGICGGHQLMVMANGYTFAHDMGRGFFTYSVKDLVGDGAPSPIEILKEDPIFDSLPNPFYATKFHGWEVVVLGEFEVLAASDCVEIIKHNERMVYGTQFHPESNKPFNVGCMIMQNFLKIALDLSRARPNNL